MGPGLRDPAHHHVIRHAPSGRSHAVSSTFSRAEFLSSPRPGSTAPGGAGALDEVVDGAEPEASRQALGVLTSMDLRLSPRAVSGLAVALGVLMTLVPFSRQSALEKGGF